MTMRCSALFVALAAAGMAQTAPPTNPWDLGHPDAKLLMGIDLKGLRDSNAGQLFGAQMKAQPQAAGAVTMGMSFLEKIDRVFISSPSLMPAAAKPAAGQAPGAARLKTAAAPVNPPFLVVIEGTLPLQQLLAFLPGTSRRYHEVDVFHGNQANDSSFAALDARTILMGDEKSVLAAIDRRGHALPPTAILKRAHELAAAHELWLIADAPLSKFQPAGAGLPNAFAEQIASQIKGLDMGLSMRNGIQFEMSLAAENEAAVAEMAKMLSTQLSLAMLAQADHPEVAQMMKKFRAETEGTHLRMSFSLTPEEFAQEMKIAQAAMAARDAAARAAAQTAAQTRVQPGRPQPKPAAPGKVKIYGLDEGVREIQLAH